MPKPSRKALVRRLLQELGILSVDEPAWLLLRERLTPVTDAQLRRLLRDLAVPVAPPYGGVRQTDLDALCQSLTDLAELYASYHAAGDRSKANLCRQVVMEAKDHAKLASRNPRLSESKRRAKAEMAQWMLVWLEDPAVFPPWAALRRQHLVRSGELPHAEQDRK
jgi:hypothetical protein